MLHSYQVGDAFVQTELPLALPSGRSGGGQRIIVQRGGPGAGLHVESPRIGEAWLERVGADTHVRVSTAANVPGDAVVGAVATLHMLQSLHREDATVHCTVTIRFERDVFGLVLAGPSLTIRPGRPEASDLELEIQPAELVALVRGTRTSRAEDVVSGDPETLNSVLEAFRR